MPSNSSARSVGRRAGRSAGSARRLPRLLDGPPGGLQVGLATPLGQRGTQCRQTALYGPARRVRAVVVDPDHLARQRAPSRRQRQCRVGLQGAGHQRGRVDVRRRPQRRRDRRRVLRLVHVRLQTA
ncbi:hypothetical protein GTW46_17510, partial [Streptomyces sp. SID6013]|nr:hypothetical protein [Streptomyces sp. SID6013]